MRKRHKTLQKAEEKGDIGAPLNTDPGADSVREDFLERQAMGELPALCNRLPWETSTEYAKFQTHLLQGPARSIRKAYRQYCLENGITPKKDPPSSWYELAKEGPLAIRTMKKQAQAIERAGAVYGRAPDWDRLELLALIRDDRFGKYDGEIGEVMDSIVLTELAFWSLAIDLDGNPVPDLQTWAERETLYQAAIARGEIERPPEPTPEEQKALEEKARAYLVKRGRQAGPALA